MERAPYGSWRSPISAELLVAGSVSIGEVHVGTDDVWWSEARPEEGGRVQLVRHRPGGHTVDVLPDGFGARTRVHEYGGGAWWLHGDDVVFTNTADQRLWRLAAGSDHPQPLTPVPAVEHADRFADGRFTADGRWVVCVRERHTDSEPCNEIVAVRVHPDGEPEDATVLVTGADFYAAPRVATDGTSMAFLRWNHPDMPWDGTELCVVHLHDDRPLDVIVAGEPVVLAGGRHESITQPEWTPDGSLLFISDRSDWWNLHRLAADDVREALRSGSTPSPDRVAALAPVEAEIGLPHWVFGESRFTVLTDGRLLVAWYRDGIDHLGVIGADGGAMVPLESPFTEISSVRAFGNGAVLVGASTTAESVVAAIDVPAAPDVDGSTAVRVAVVRPARDLGLGVEWFSVPEPVEFATTGGRTAHALFYPPTNPGFTGPEGERPPLIVMSHGGPTSAARPRLALGVQFWTSRGFGVVDVNYGGSTGFGRAYRQRLHGAWGVVDVDDVVAAAEHLVARGDADPDRLVIRGGSAGGYTTLCALTFRDVFAAGASHYGIGDLTALARDTHKFEARYLDSLVGPWPERADLYAERSPINRTDGLDAPLIVFQGLDDAVVPPNQAEAMVAALESKGLPWAHLAFEGEGHGFRRAETIRRALEAEAWFYSQVLGFELADEVEPVAIANL